MGVLARIAGVLSEYSALPMTLGGTGTAAPYASFDGQSTGYVANGSERVIALTGTLATARTVTLAAAAKYPAGTRVLVLDQGGSLSQTLYVNVRVATGDTLDNGNISTAGTFRLTAPYAAVELETDGASMWTVIDATPALTFGGAITGTQNIPIGSGAYTITGTGYTLTLPGIANVNVPNMTVTLDKRDGSGVVYVRPSGTDTWANAPVTNIPIYQESITISLVNGQWYIVERDHGWITVAKRAALTTGAQIGYDTATEVWSGDTELDEIEYAFNGITLSAAGSIVGLIYRGGTIVTSYATSAVYASSTSAATAGGNTAATTISLTAQTATLGLAVVLSIKNPALNGNLNASPVLYRGRTGNAGLGHLEGDALSSAAGVTSGFRLQANTSSINITGGGYQVRAFRT